MNHAEPPVIANGVIFAYGSGEDTDQAAFDIGLAYNNQTTLASKFDQSGALRAGCANRQRALEQRRRDCFVEPLGRAVGGEWQGLYQHV